MRNPTRKCGRFPCQSAAPGPGSSASTVMEGKGCRVFTVPAPSPANDWYKVNSDQTGFFRVNYTAEDWGSDWPRRSVL